MSSSPIFVLGKHRSGTTWLANELCQHPDIAGVQEPRQNTVVESLFFSHLAGRYGDLAAKSSHRELAEVFAASRYATVAGISRQELLDLWPTTYPALFRTVMDRFATRRGARYWLEKTPGHTPVIESLAASYPDAKFIGIVRAPREVAASTVAFHARLNPGARRGPLRRWVALVRMLGAWSYYAQALEHFARHDDRILLISYEDLLRDRQGTLAKVCRFLDVPEAETMRQRVSHRNSSFDRDHERAEVLSKLDLGIVAVSVRAFAAVPFATMSGLASVADRVGSRRPLPPWFFDDPTPSSAPQACPTVIRELPS